MNIWSWLLPFLISSPTFAMSDTLTGQLWNCHVPEKQLTVLAIEPLTYRGYTFDLFRLDRNADGSQDTILIYPTVNKRRSPFPVYYLYDMNFDGRPDKAYHDTQGNGICQQMEEFDANRFLADKDT